jgi:hypothetical protein
MQNFGFLMIQVKFEYYVMFGEYQSRRPLFLKVFEEKLGGYMVEHWVFLHQDAFFQDETVSISSFFGQDLLKDEELVMFLFILDEILAADDCEPQFTLAQSHSHNFVGFPAHRNEE